MWASQQVSPVCHWRTSAEETHPQTGQSVALAYGLTLRSLRYSDLKTGLCWAIASFTGYSDIHALLRVQPSRLAYQRRITCSASRVHALRISTEPGRLQEVVTNNWNGLARQRACWLNLPVSILKSAHMEHFRHTSHPMHAGSR